MVWFEYKKRSFWGFFLLFGDCVLVYGDEFFCCCWVNGDGVVEVFFGGVYFQGYCKVLQYFIYFEVDVVDVDNFFFWVDVYQFYVVWLMVRGYGGIYCGEGRFVDFYGVVVVLFVCLWFG